MKDLKKLYFESWLPIDDSHLYNELLIYKESKGMNVWMEGDETPYIDLVLGYCAMNFGHNPEFLINVIRELCGKIHHIHSIPSSTSIKLCYNLKNLIKGKKEYKVYLPVGGSETVSDSIKLAMAYKGKNKVIKCNGSFHGFGFYPMHVTDSSFIINRKLYLSKNEEILNIPYCNPNLCKYGEDSLGCNTFCLNNIEEYLLNHKNEFACIIIEPIQGANGFIIPKREYAERISDICEENNILLIIDEIQVGIGRSGTMFAYENIGFKDPDMVLLGKSLAGGLYPLGAIIGRKDIADSIELPSPFSSTFSRSPIGASLAISVLEYMRDQFLLSHVRKIGKQFLEELRNKLNHSFVKCIRGRGLCIAFDVEQNKHNISSDVISKVIVEEGINNHLLLYACGVKKNTIKLMPSLLMTEKEMIEIVNKLKIVCDNVERIIFNDEISFENI